MRKTLLDLRRMHRDGERIAMLTCYDATFAVVLEAAGIDVLLVGDSLGMVIQGHDNPLPVTLGEMVYHTRAVARGSTTALILADMPFGTSQLDPVDTYRNAAELMRAGAHMVKLEGGEEMAATVAFLAGRGIPVCAHVGLTPQSVNRFGGFRVQGRDAEGSLRIVAAARVLEAAGADLVLMEGIPRTLADGICEAVVVPTIGIGASPRCSGQVLVLHDLLGITPGKRPRFVKDFLARAPGVGAAVEAYVRAVKDGSFPAPEHCYD